MVRFYLKSLLVFAVLTLLLLGLAELVRPGYLERNLDGVPVICLLIWLFLDTKHVLSTRWISGPERWRVRHRIEILVEMPAAEALERCVRAVERLPQFKSMGPRDGETIEARTRTGDRVSCRVVALDGHHARVLVSSRPTWPTVTVDDGSNWANVVAIRDALLSGLPPSKQRSQEGPGPRARSPRRTFRPRELARASGRPAARREP